MAKLTLSPITDNDHAVTMNANLDLIEAAIENTLSRDGTSPNQMNDEFDLNSNFIINMPPGTAATHPLQKQQIEALITAGVGGGAITLNSLVDVVVPAPTVLDVLTFDGVNWINAPSLAIPFPILTDTLLRSDGATYVEGSNRLRVDANGVLTFRDVSGNDTLAISHPGTDGLFAFTNTGDLNITGLTGRINQGAEVLAFVSELSSVSELSDLSDVNTSTPTNRFVLIADGVDFESRALEAADIPFAGDISSSGTPLNDQIAVFVDGSTIEGDPQFEWDGVNKRLEIFGSGLSNRTRYYHDNTDGIIQQVNGGQIRITGMGDGIDIESNAASPASNLFFKMHGDADFATDFVQARFVNDNAGDAGGAFLDIFGNRDTTVGQVRILHTGASSTEVPITGGPATSHGGIGTIGAALPFSIFTNTIERARFDGATGQFALQNYSFPVADGSPNQVLETNGSGVLSFVTPAAAFVHPDPHLLGDGTAGAPTYSFSSETNSGMYYDGQPKWSVIGTEVMRMDDTGVLGPSASAPTWYLVSDESASGTNPIYAFNNDNNTGLGRNAAGEPSLIGAGTELMRLAVGGVSVFANLLVSGDVRGSTVNSYELENAASTATNPTLLPNRADSDTGIGGIAGVLSLIQNGVEIAQGTTAAAGGLLVNNDLTGAGLERVLTVGDLNGSIANDAVQARRTTVYTLTTAFVDITMDTTDIETDAAVLDHDLATNTDNIIAGVTGTYEVAVDYDVISTAASGDPVISVDTRVRLNDAGTGILGSIIAPYSYRDGSVGGADGNISKHISNSFLVSLTATDFITLQLGKTEITGSDTFEVSNICVKVKRLI